MSEHLNNQQIDLDRRRRLSAGELRVIDEHLTACEACAQRLMSAAERESALASVLNYCAPLATHLSYEQLESYVDGGLTPPQRSIVETHVETCERCRTDLENLRAFSSELTFDPAEQPVRTVETPSGARSFARGLRRWFLPLPVMSAAAAALLLVAVVSTAPLRQEVSRLRAEQTRLALEKDKAVSIADAQVFRLQAKQTGLEQAKDKAEQTGRNAVARASHQTQIATALQVQRDQARDKAEQARLEIGRIAGHAQQLTETNRQVEIQNADLKRQVASSLLGPLQESDQHVIALAQTTGNMPIRSSALLPGWTAQKYASFPSEAPFGPKGPIGSAVLSNHPTLCWYPYQGAAGYKVEVKDPAGKVVAQTDKMIPGNITQWQADRPLPRGGIYTWQVYVYANSASTKSFQKFQRPAQFKILDRQTADLDLDARRKLAVLDVQRGLLDEAEAALREVADADADSKIGQNALKLLKSLRDQRGEVYSPDDRSSGE